MKSWEIILREEFECRSANIKLAKKHYDDYLRTERWAFIRQRALLRYGGRCALCNSRGDIVLHHKTYEHLGDELANMDDLTALCRGCHNNFHNNQCEEN